MLYYLPPLLGGVAIGLSATLLWLVYGRVAGISGILSGSVWADEPRDWRVAFLAGLVCAGVFAALWVPAAVGSSPVSTPGVLIAGLLVGVGTRLGNGCTSGHGVCGLSRGSTRSLAATLTFMGMGGLIVAVMRWSMV